VPYDDGSPAVLTHEDGTPITNIHPYSSTGEPLTGVLLYDQDGRPIDDLADWTAEGFAVEPVPGAPLQPDNAYPQQRQVLTADERGEPVTVPMPGPTAAPTPSAPTPTEPGVPPTP
jgi:hypothetical protein